MVLIIFLYVYLSSLYHHLELDLLVTFFNEVVYYWVLRGFLFYIYFEYIVFYQICLTNTFFQSVACLILLIVCLTEHVFNFNEVQFINPFFLWIVPLRHNLKCQFQPQDFYLDLLLFYLPGFLYFCILHLGL